MSDGGVIRQETRVPWRVGADGIERVQVPGGETGVAELVLRAFRSEPAGRKPYWLDLNRANNRPSNLAWCAQEAEEEDAWIYNRPLVRGWMHVNVVEFIMAANDAGKGRDWIELRLPWVIPWALDDVLTGRFDLDATRRVRRLAPRVGDHGGWRGRARPVTGNRVAANEDREAREVERGDGPVVDPLKGRSHEELVALDEYLVGDAECPGGAGPDGEGAGADHQGRRFQSLRG